MRGALGLALMVAALGPAGAWAAEGDLDLSFNGTGKVVTLLGGQTDTEGIDDVAIDDQGRLAAVGQTTAAPGGFAIARYRPNGSLDSSFNGGVVITQVGSSSRAQAGMLDGQGRIVAVGWDQGSNGSFDTDFAVARFLPDGTLDPGFNGTGKVQTPVTTSVDQANAVAVDGQNRVYAVGLSLSDWCVVRYKADGQLDTDFSSDGIATTDFAGSVDRAYGAVVDGQGRLIVVGYASVTNQDLAIARYLPDGSLDPDFGTGGKLTVPMGTTNSIGNAVAVDSQGRIVVAGGAVVSGTNDLAVVRLTPGGQLDPSFGSGGKVLTPVSPHDDVGYGLTIDRLDRPVVAGTTSNGSITKLLVARYLTDGSPDPAFNGTGAVVTSIGPSSDGASGVAIDGQDRIVAAGYSDGSNNYAHFALARYVGDAVAPTATITSGPAEGSATNSAAPAFGFASSEAGSTFGCRFDLLALTSCTSPYLPGAALADGPHVFGVVATDRAGNASAEATRNFTVDTAAPSASITSGPANGSFTRDATPSFGLASSEAGGTFTCRFDSATAACTSPAGPAAPLADGPHVFAAVAHDLAGNASAEATRSFTVDTRRARLRIAGKKTTRIRGARGRVRFRLKSSEPVKLRCRVDRRRAAKCKAKFLTPKLRRGRHVLAVTATDRAGNVTHARKRFRIASR